jgi:conjugative transposon TraM protein
MENKEQSLQRLRQRNFMLILPLLTLPFLTIIFWAFGGGGGDVTAANQTTSNGINLKLPDAKFKAEKGLDKLSFYKQAALDSAKQREAEKLDPYWNRFTTDSTPGTGHEGLNNSDNGFEANRMKVYGKLNELKAALDHSQKSSGYDQQQTDNRYSLRSYKSADDFEKLQLMMQRMEEEKTEDPEITQLNNMLDKIAAIQNPPLKAENAPGSTIAKTFSVNTASEKAEVSLLNTGADQLPAKDTATDASNAFYGQTNFNDSAAINNEAIEAIVPETQTMVTGSTVKLALMNDVTIRNNILPSGTLIYGTGSLSNERLKISITSIRIKNSILPVALDVYDMDGQEGIFVPGSINRTVAKESANSAINGVNANTLDPSIGAQAASAGIEAAKTLFTKKVKLVRLTVTTGYKVLLRDSHDK